MFIKLLHGLHSVVGAIQKYIQHWTNVDVPDGTRTVHNFHDGQGKVPAVPYDESMSSNGIFSVSTDSKFENTLEELSSSGNILKVKLHTELANSSDNLTNETGIKNTVCNPDPIIFEIQNEVPDKIEKIVPVKTQALPGQDYIFEIFYVKDYSYIDGDILPVFGTWGRYARISSNGRYLTVNSDADLTVRLVLTPTPQDWIPEHPDSGAIQEPTDRQLNVIPRDGARYDYTVEETKLEDNFYVVNIENQASTFVNNSEFSNGKQYLVYPPNDKLSIPMSFTEGFDENAIYWKCYDDPKGFTPVTGSFPSKDYNEEFEPLPDPIYRKARYIYSNGYCYIDTGYKLKAGDKVKILAQIDEYTDSSYIGLFGSRNWTSSNDWYSTNGAYATYVRFNGYRNICFERNNQVKYTNSSIDWNKIYGSVYSFETDGKSFKIKDLNGTTLCSQAVDASHDIDTTYNCFIGTVNDKGSAYNYGARGYFYRVEIFDSNDNVIMRLIPVYNTVAKIYGMYDLISNKFFTNKRGMQAYSGALFYVWQKPMQCSKHDVEMSLYRYPENYNTEYTVPEDYTKIYGIYMTNSYVNTNYKIKKNDKVEVIANIDNNTSQSYRCLFGARTGSFSADNYFFFTRFSSSNIPCFGKNGQETTGSNLPYGKTIKIVSEANKVSWYNVYDDVVISKINVSGTATDCNYNCWIGCGNNSNNPDSYCFATYCAFRIYNENDELVLNYIPVKRNSDGVIGFYDTISETFIGRTGGSSSYTFSAATNTMQNKIVLQLANIHSDLSLGIIRNPVYDEPFKLEGYEDDHENKPIDEIETNYELISTSLNDYFWVVNNVNNATDYATFNTSYNTVNCGNNTQFILTYKSGYDNYDITCTANNGAEIEVGKSHYITYDELNVPAEYAIIKGLYSNNSSTYFKTSYIPKWDDKVVCYCSISNNRSTYPCYVFGARNGVNNRSFVFYAHRSNYDYVNYFAYDRCCGETQIRLNEENQLLKITADNNGCETDFAYTKSRVDTQMYTVPLQPDYNPDITLPVEYEKLSFLQNTGRSYINTEIILKQTYKTECALSMVDSSGSWQGLYGAETGSTNECYSVYSRSAGNRRFCFSLGNTDNVFPSDYSLNTNYIIRTSNESARLYNFDETLLQTRVPGGTHSDSRFNAWLFGINRNNSLYNNQSSYVKIYCFKIYDENDELICHMIPAVRKSDAVPGMYDLVRNRFFTNSGSDAFTIGRISNSIYPDCSYEMYIFSCNNAGSKQGSYYGNMYKFTIYNGAGQPVVNLIPVKRLSDSKLGFYDTTRQLFIVPSGGAVSEAAEPTYKSYVKVTNITADTTVTMVKNNANRKNLILEQNEDTVIHNFDLINSSITDYFWYVKYNNSAGYICSIYAPISTYYNTPRVGNDTRFPITYNIGYDNTDVEVHTNNNAIATLNEPLKIVYDIVPDEYFVIPGLYSNSRNTYFDIDYIPKAYDKVTCFANINETSYTYYLFGVNDGEGTRSLVFCTRYTSDNENFYFDRCKRLNCPRITRDEIVKIEGDYTGVSYTNGYDSYSYTLENVNPQDCSRHIYVFGCNWNGSRQSSAVATIYKFTLSDEYGLKLNLIPVKRKIDNVLGFYDTVGDKFYTPAGGSVSEVAWPKMKGGIYVTNITEDTEITVTPKQKQSITIDDAIETSYNLEKATLEDHWYYINVNNLTNGILTFNNQVYTNYYTCLAHNDIDMSVTYRSGYDSNNFIVSEGVLTNSGWKLTNVSSDKILTVMLNDYHDPVCLSDDDLGIFTDTSFDTYNQYIIIEGNDVMLSKYTLINSQPALMTDRDIYEFNTENIDLLGFNPTNNPGPAVPTKIASTDSNIDEVITNITVNSRQLYKHVFTLRNQIKLEVGKQYIFKVRNNYDTGKIIACAKDTASRNLVNCDNIPYVADNKLYFDWNDTNKYIVTGNMSIYFEINGVKQ